MTERVARILAEAYSNWPQFEEHRTAIAMELHGQQGIFDTLEDLRIAYATVVGKHMDFDWRAQMKKTLLLLLAVLAAGCDAEVKRVQLETYTEVRTVSCKTTGICGGVNSDGTYSLGFRLSCPGTRQASILVKPYEVTYESGAVRQYETTVTQGYLGSCEQ